MTGRDIIEKKVAKRLKENPESAKEIGAKIAVELSGEGGGRWILDCSKNPAQVIEDQKTAVDTTIQMSGENLVKLSTGKMNAVSAFMFGKIKVDGDIGIAVKLGKILT